MWVHYWHAILYRQCAIREVHHVIHCEVSLEMVSGKPDEGVEGTDAIYLDAAGVQDFFCLQIYLR